MDYKVRFYFVPLALIVSSYLLYHLSQKAVPEDANPAASLVVTYLGALILSLLMFFAFPAKQGVAQAFGHLNWGSYALALAVVGLEAGFLVAYRFGWKLSTTAVYANVITGVALLPIGIIFFKERFTPMRGLGLVFAVIGILMLSLGNKPAGQAE